MGKMIMGHTYRVQVGKDYVDFKYEYRHIGIYGGTILKTNLHDYGVGANIEFTNISGDLFNHITEIGWYWEK